MPTEAMICKEFVMGRRASNGEVFVTGIRDLAQGGDGVGALPDGRTVFVSGAYPGERVRAVVTTSKKRFARAKLVDVPSGELVTPIV